MPTLSSRFVSQLPIRGMLLDSMQGLSPVHSRWIADAKSLESGMTEFSRIQPATDERAAELVSCLRAALDVSREGPVEVIESISGYAAHLVSLMAGAGLKKMAFNFARELQSTPPYDRAAAIRTILNPENAAIYGAAHPAFEPQSPVKRDDGATVLFAAGLSGTMYLQDEGPDVPALKDLKAWFRTSGVRVAYVSGKSLMNVWDAVMRYALPIPDYVSSEMGTRIFHNDDGAWTELTERQSALASRWTPEIREQIDAIMQAFPDAEKPPKSQGAFKQSYRIYRDLEWQPIFDHIAAALSAAGMEVDFSVGKGGVEDADVKHRGEHLIHIDFLPRRGSKFGAIRFIAEREDVPLDRVIVGGDTGADSEALTSGARGIFVGTDAQLLQELAGKRMVFHATAPGARGIIEGLKHFGVM